MLQQLRDQTQGTGFKIFVGALIAVFVLFGFGASNLLPSSDPEVASVGGQEITQSALDVATERERLRLIAQMGPDFDPSSIDRLQLQGYVLEQLISRYVLYQAAKDLDIQVSQKQSDSELLNNQAYQVDGRFDEDVFLQRLRMLGYNSPLEFRAEVTDALSSDQLRRGLVDSVFVADWELAESVQVLTQKRDLAYLPLTIEHFSKDIVVSSEEVALRYEEEQASFMTDLSVDVQYISIGASDLLDDDSIEVSDEEIEEIYAEDKASFALDDQRDSSHILIEINDARDEETALSLITEISAKLNGGAAFEELVEEFSEDAGSAAQQGSLGPVSKGVFDPAFEQALWAIEEVGQVSAPIKSSFGYHLVRLDEIVVQDYPSLDEQRVPIAERIKLARAQDLMVDRALALERSAYDEQYSLDETAESFGLEVQEASHISRTEQTGHELLLGNAAVLEMIFSDEVLAGENSPLLEVGDTTLIVRVTAQHEPVPIPLADVTEQITEALTREKALVAIESAKNNAYARLEAGEGVTEIGRTYDVRWVAREAVVRAARDDTIPSAVMKLAFDLPRPPVGQKSVGVTTLPDGAALVTVTRVEQGNLNATTDVEVAQLQQGLTNRTSQVSFGSFFRSAEEEFGVSRLLVTSQTPGD